MVYQASDSVFEMVPLETSQREGSGTDDVDGLPIRSISARKTPQPIDPFLRGRRPQSIRYLILS